MGKKGQRGKQQDEGQVYMQRLQANLEYFRVNRPALYQLLANIQLQRSELVVTPGQDDVDMVVNGKSCYRGLAREYSIDEAEKVLKENPQDKPILTFAPPGEDKYQQENVADYLLRQVIAGSPAAVRPFRGYLRGNVFPSLVFLGCGLGYHIDSLVRKTTIINAIVVEKEPEKFALSLYTVDWAAICSRFAKRGQTLSFVIGKANTEQEIRTLVHQHMTKDVPFYPFFSTYYNHLADVELARGVIAASKDLSVITSNWSNYDNEMLRLINVAHNVRRGMRYLRRPAEQYEQAKPLVVVGSGPSLDQRMASLRAVREKVVIASAGTGIRPLIAAGIRPDFHIELDPSHLIYRLLAELPRDELRTIPLIAVNEVNPWVPPLFDSVYYFFKTDNNVPHLLGTHADAFSGCNPTVTNSALAIGKALGFETVYLFGTDYGFEDETKDHAQESVYGKGDRSEIGEQIRKVRDTQRANRQTFEVPGVKGRPVKTLGGYYSAKRSVEDLVFAMKSRDKALRVFNCSDGAVIDGVDWLSEESFHAQVAQAQDDSGVELREVLAQSLATLPGDALDACLPDLYKEVGSVCQANARILKAARLKGRKDLCLLVNELRQAATLVTVPRPGMSPRPEQLYANQLLKGTFLHFLYVGLTHGMACEDRELGEFLMRWRDRFLTLLGEIPRHFETVMSTSVGHERDPWTIRGLRGRDPEFREEDFARS